MAIYDRLFQKFQQALDDTFGVIDPAPPADQSGQLAEPPQNVEEILESLMASFPEVDSESSEEGVTYAPVDSEPESREDLQTLWRSEPNVSGEFDAESREYEAGDLEDHTLEAVYSDLTEWERFMMACICYCIPPGAADHCQVSYRAIEELARERGGPYTSSEKIKEGFTSLEEKGYIRRVQENGALITYICIPNTPAYMWADVLDMDYYAWRRRT